MCVIIHKPAGVAIPPALLTASASLNRDGWGLMGFDATGGLLLERHARVDVAELLEAEQRYRDVEIVLHLRMLTRGSTHAANIHPLPVDEHSFLMHNGTVDGLDTPVCGRSDSWHLATEVLRPLIERDPSLIEQPAFTQLIELALGPQNRAVLLHAPSRRIHIFNRRHGAEIDGLWCSGTRWIDERHFAVPAAPQPQERSLLTEHLRFI